MSGPDFDLVVFTPVEAFDLLAKLDDAIDRIVRLDMADSMSVDHQVIEAGLLARDVYVAIADRLTNST